MNIFIYDEKKTFIPWTGEYFESAIRRREALIQAPAIDNYNNYEILKTIEGGMSQVQIARKSSNRELYALKSIKPESVLNIDDKMLIADEASKSIGISANNILQVEEVLWDYDRGTCILVFPYCIGESLHDRILAGNLGIDEIIFYALSTAIGLADLHDSECLHLDLKPSNILLEYLLEDDGKGWWRLAISDLGIAREIKKGRDTQSISGTLTFMSPEQFIDQPVTYASDVWGFGATFYAVITNLLPFGRNGCFDPQSKLFTKCANPPNTLRSDCPSWLSEIIMRCLEIDPGRRYQNFDQVLRDLLKYIRVEDCTLNKNSKSYSGTTAEKAHLIIQERHWYVLNGLEGRRMAEGVHTARINLGWLTILKEASKLFATHAAGPTRKALDKVDLILGTWDDPDSPIAQFLKDPEKDEYEFEKYWEAKRNKSKYKYWGELSPRMTPGGVRELLDLRCMCLVTLVEDLAIPVDLKYLEDTAQRWLKTNSLGYNHKDWEGIKITHNQVDISSDKSIYIGPPRELCLGRIAQGYRHAGKYQEAKNILLDALKTWPDQSMLLTTLSLTYRDMGNYDSAIATGQAGVKQAENSNDYSQWLRWLRTLSEFHLQAGEIDIAIKILETLYERTENITMEVHLLRARARKAKKATKADFEVVYPYATKQALLTPWIIATEIAYYAGLKVEAKKIAEYLLADPRMHLPVWKKEYDNCKAIALNSL